MIGATVRFTVHDPDAVAYVGTGTIVHFAASSMPAAYPLAKTWDALVYLAAPDGQPGSLAIVNACNLEILALPGTAGEQVLDVAAPLHTRIQALTSELEKIKKLSDAQGSELIALRANARKGK